MKNDQRNKYLGLINIAFQMGIIIAAGVFLGIWLDEKFPNKFSAYTIIFSLLGVFIALYQVFRAVKNLNDDE
ncbi:AtpZ/AtpI family protein [Pontixanthobacter gangjinensis]|uniref:AtpZ/AtpI family protein n=1 Tax=Christiangramia aestuarii TaxID=1028746 RepID=A0A7K1LR97_9FLAO|nr:AtpZ/AtpI family protein [Christiangramia aestuarii]MUP43332.1 AtpZ/AtpI family protein [Christiangramia aestuarii]